METSLRPLSLGEILDRTAQLYRSNFVLFAGIAAVYAGVMLVLGLLQIGLAELLRILHMTQQLQWLTWTAAGAVILLMFIFAGMAVAANNRAVAWVHLGESATIRGAYLSILPRLGRYLWLMTITAFVVWLPLVLVYGGYLALILLYVRPSGLLAHSGASANPQVAMVFFGATLAFCLLVLLAFVYGVVMFLRYSLAVPACVVENLKARQALRRSVALSKGARGRIFVLGLLVFVIEIGLVLMTQIFFVVLAFKHGQLPVGLRVLQQIVGFFTNAFIGPIYATGLTLFYYDQRVRKEGYDIEWMMQAAGLTAPAIEPAQLTASIADSTLSAESAPQSALEAKPESPQPGEPV
jgi:uncharacterized membrane protein